MQFYTSPPSLAEGFGGRSIASHSVPTPTPSGGRSFASPAMIRILLIPANTQVTPDDFEMMAGIIRRTESVKLSELPKSQIRGEAVPAFSALGKTGEVLLSFVTSYDPSHSFLAPFNLHRQVLGVLGLSTIDSHTNMEDLKYSPSALRQLHPGAIIHRVFAFDKGAARPNTVDLSSIKNESEIIESESQEASTSNNDKSGFSGRESSGLIVFPAVRKDLKDVKFYLKTLLPEFVSTLLEGLDTTIKGLQGKPLETPRETLDVNMMYPVRQPPSSSKSPSSSSAIVTTSRTSSIFSSFTSTDEKRLSKNSSRNSKSGSSAANVGPLGAGRYGKVKADYYLLAGDLWNALHTYDSCMNLLGKEKALVGGQDAVWFASALEGWAVARYLVARMGGAVEERASCLELPLGGTKEKDKDKEKEKIEFQFHKQSWSDIAEAYSIAITIYSKCLAPISYLLESWKSITPDTPRDYTHPLIHTSACLAYSRLLLAIWASGGWNGETFDQLLYGGIPPALAETLRPSLAVYTQHCTASGIQRSDIAAAASLAMTNSSTNGLKLLDQINLYSTLAALFSAIGFTRREAYAVRRLQVLVVSMIANGLALQKREASMSSQVIRDADKTANSQRINGTMVSTMFSTGMAGNADSIIILIMQVCKSYGIEIDKMPFTNLNDTHILSRAANNVKSGKDLSGSQMNRERTEWSQVMSSIEEAGSEVDKKEAQCNLVLTGTFPHFGWVSLQISILQEAISICEMMQDELAMLFFATIFLRDLWTYLTTNDQLRLKDGIADVQRSLEAKGEKFLMDYWGPTALLDDMELISIADTVSVKDLKSIKSGTSSERAADSMKSNAKISAKSEIAQIFDGDVVFFRVTLFNPLSVPLEIESICLDVARAGSVGPLFKSKEAISIVIPPMRHHTIQLSGTPQGEGKLLLLGIIVKLPYCTPKKFAFERTDGENREQLARFQSDSDDASSRIKVSGLGARRNTEQEAVPRPKIGLDHRFTALQVIQKVPRLVVQGTNLIRNGLLIICEGEENSLQITLRNQSEVNIDYMRFTMEDNLQSEMLDILAEGRMDPVHVYELEYDLIHRPFIRSTDDVREEAAIEAGQVKTFKFRVKGKININRARIKMEYGNMKEAKEMGREQFWIRSSKIEFDVQVLPTVQVDGCEIIQCQDDDDDNQVMLDFCVHNMHSSDVVLDWQIANQTLQHPLASSTTSHIHFTIPKILLTDEKMEEAIPILMERQFMFSSRDSKGAENRSIQTRFWSRQALLQMIKTCKWRDEKMKRRGEINLNGLSLPEDERSLSLLRRSRVKVNFKIEDSIEKFAFIHLDARIENVSTSSITADYRLIPNVQERLVNHIQCTNGTFHAPIHPSSNSKDLLPSQSSEIRIGLCFLSSGLFPFIFRIVQHDKIIFEKWIDINVH